MEDYLQHLLVNRIRQRKTIVVTSDYTVKLNDCLLVNTSNGAINLTLPSSPTPGFDFTVVDTHNNFQTNNVTLLRNGNLINGANSDFVLNSSGGHAFVYFVGGLVGWKIVTLGLGDYLVWKNLLDSNNDGIIGSDRVDSGTAIITRDGNGNVSTIQSTMKDGRVVTVTYTYNNDVISTATTTINGSEYRTITYNYSSDVLTGWTVVYA